MWGEKPQDPRFGADNIYKQKPSSRRALANFLHLICGGFFKVLHMKTHVVFHEVVCCGVVPGEGTLRLRIAALQPAVSHQSAQLLPQHGTRRRSHPPRPTSTHTVKIFLWKPVEREVTKVTCCLKAGALWHDPKATRHLNSASCRQCVLSVLLQYTIAFM